MDKEGLKNYRFLLRELKQTFNYSREGYYWGNIPINISSLRVIDTIYKPKFKFLDLGCGSGNVLEYAKNIGYDVFGVEYDKSLEKYLHEYKYLIYNIEDLDEKFFEDFDVIYSYLPLKKNKEKFLKKVIKGMKINSLLYIPYNTINDSRVKEISNCCFKKINNKEVFKK